MPDDDNFDLVEQPPEAVQTIRVAKVARKAVPSAKALRQTVPTAVEVSNPHNLDAEQGLLASCFMEEGREVLAHCIASGLKPSSFYRPQHQIIFEAILTLHRKGEPATDEITVANYLRDKGELDAIGGHAYIYELTDRIQTTVHAKHWAEIVKDKSVLRQIIRASKWAQSQITEAGSENAAELLSSIKTTFERIAQESAGDGITGKGIMEYALTQHNENNLLGDDWLEKDAALLVNSNAGVGKSSWTFQAACTWGLGLPFFGINPVRKMRSLIVQWEDSDRYTAKCAESLKQAWNLNPEQQKDLNNNVIVVRVRCTGTEFYEKLKQLTKKYQPDLVWINPISNYIQGDLSDQETVVTFFNEIDRANEGGKYAYILIHHTGKPPKGDAAKGKEDDWAQIYMGYGSSAFANRPRAGINLEPRRGMPGEFWMHLGKGGRNAGVTKEVTHGVGTRLEITTKVSIKYTDKKIKMQWGELPMFFWEKSDAEEEIGAKGEIGAPRKYDRQKILDCYPQGAERAKGAESILRDAREAFGIPPSSFHNIKDSFLTAGLVKMTGDRRFYRPLNSG